jgi:hypothetical protein
LRAECNFVVHEVHLINHIFANEGGAHIIVGVGVSSGASFLEPEKGVLHAVYPSRVLGDALVGIGRGWDLET